MTPPPRVRAAAAALAVAAAGAIVAGCGSSGAPSGKSLTIADKGFTESAIVTQIYAQALQAKGYTVDVKSLASSAIADAAIRKGDIQMYPDYTGTLLTDVLKVPFAQVPTTTAGQVAKIRSGEAARGLTVLDVAPFNNDNEVACTAATVAKYHLTTLSSLAKAAPSLTYSANPEHLQRPDGYPLLEKSYGIHFGHIVQVDIGLRYRPIESGQAQCVYAFGTDPQIAQDKLVVLTDDKGRFHGAPYQGIPVVSTKYLATAPADFKTIVNGVSAKLTSPVVRALDAKVVLGKQDPKDVAKAFLASGS